MSTESATNVEPLVVSEPKPEPDTIVPVKPVTSILSPRLKTARKPVKKIERSTTFDLKYFHGNALPSRRAKFDWSLAYEPNTLPCEKSHQEAMTNKKNREQHLNLFEQEPSQAVQNEVLQQRRQGFNLITGEAYNDRPVSALSVKTSTRFMVHSPR